MKKRIASLLLVLLLAAAAVPAASAFSDVPGDHWACREIEKMAALGVIQGSGGAFRPAESVSRQAFLSMVCRASGLDDRDLEPGENWWQPSQAYAHYFGWCSETELNEANRSESIPRELAAKLLVKAFFPDQVTGSGKADFTDWDSVDPSCRLYVQTAAELGLIGGYADGTVRPKGTLTRAAAAALISRALEMKETVRGETVQIPILMYHDVSYLGRGYSKTPEEFRRQMEELKAAGFQTVFFSQVIDFADSGAPLPSRPIVITFDDGYLTNHTYVLPVLRELGMKAEISLIGDAVEYTDWGLSWELAREMQESGLVRFQAHTKGLHDAPGRTGVLKKAEESWADYVTLFAEDTRAIRGMLAYRTGREPQVFTYPLGKHNAMTEAIVRQMGFRASLTTKDGVAEVTYGNPESLYLMDRIGMDFETGSVLRILKRYGYQK